MFINIVFGAVAVIGGLVLLTNQGRSPHLHLDVPGTVTASAGLFAVVFGFGEAETYGWGAGRTITSLGIGVVLLIGFVILEKQVASPLVPLRIVTERSRAGSFLVIAAAGVGLFTMFLFLSYFLQGTLHYSPIRTGLAFLPLFGVFFPVAAISQANLPRLDLRALYLVGLLVAASGLVWLARLTPASSYLTGVLPGLLIVPLGLGAAAPAALNMATRGLQDEDAGAAGAMTDVAQQIAAAMGLALLSTLAAHTTGSYLRHHATGADLVRAAVQGDTTAFISAAAIIAVLALVTAALVSARGPATRGETRPEIHADDAAPSRAADRRERQRPLRRLP